ncbi:SDR family oxidoreductase [Dactylosporangium darangshiense]|uniref:SDR family oxidoreductase n=1 Tax=Dactylosporangium darangshiense TaxID=579108 RepID=A0ABP8DUL4_9ACTN
MTSTDPSPVGGRSTASALTGKTVVILGGSSGIGLETARQARNAGASVVMTGRNAGRLAVAAEQIGPDRTATFDVTDHDALVSFFATFREPIDHLMVTAGGPYYAPLADIDLRAASAAFHQHVGVMIDVAQLAGTKIRAGGTIILMGGTAPRRPEVGLIVPAAVSTGLSAAAATLALELAPVRVNVIAAGFVDTPLSAMLVGERLEARRQELSERLPIRRVVEAGDVAALAVHLMVNTALTGATFDIDGGQQLVAGL